jgi:hypothetical protein
MIHAAHVWYLSIADALEIKTTLKHLNHVLIFVAMEFKRQKQFIQFSHQKNPNKYVNQKKSNHAKQNKITATNSTVRMALARNTTKRVAKYARVTIHVKIMTVPKIPDARLILCPTISKQMIRPYLLPSVDKFVNQASALYSRIQHDVNVNAMRIAIVEEIKNVVLLVADLIVYHQSMNVHQQQPLQ